jgi:transposase
VVTRATVKVVGFDCAEDEHVGVVLDDKGEFERSVPVVNRQDTIQACLSELILKAGEGTQLMVVVESKRAHGRLLTDEAERLGCVVKQVNTVALKHYRDLEGQPRKNDEWDAFLAARMAFFRMGGCRELVEVTPEERALSRLTRTRSRLVDDRTQQASRVRAILLEIAPEILHRSWQGPKPDSKAMEYILGRWPGFEGLERAQLRTIEGILRRCHYGAQAAPVAKMVRAMARRIVIPHEERTVITLELSALCRQITTLNASIDSLEQEIARRVESHPIGTKLLEMRGIGTVTAGVLVSELLPIARTATEAKSATYAGITPLGRKSGKSLNSDRLAQGVNKRVLNALYTSAVAAIKCSTVDRTYYTKKLRDYTGHPTPHIAAIIALSRQRHKVIYKLMTTDARYDPEVLFARHLERIDQTRHAAA